MGWTQQQYEDYKRKFGKMPISATMECVVEPTVESKPITLSYVTQLTSDVQKLNKTERAYYDVLCRSGYAWVGVQNITLKLADDTRLTPDFAFVDFTGGMTFVDVKGFQREDALIKMRVAARMFLWAKFSIVSKCKGGWDIKQVKP